MTSEGDGPVFLAKLGDELARVAQAEAAGRGASRRSPRARSVALAGVAGLALVVGAIATGLVPTSSDDPHPVQRQAAHPHRAPTPPPVVAGAQSLSWLHASSRVSCYGRLRMRLRDRPLFGAPHGVRYSIWTSYSRATLVLKNVSHHACDVAGYPGLQLLDKRGRPLPTRVVHDRGDDAAVTLLPGEHARSPLWFVTRPALNSGLAPCKVPARVRIALPTIPGSFVLPWRLGPVCEPRTIHAEPLG